MAWHSMFFQRLLHKAASFYIHTHKQPDGALPPPKNSGKGDHTQPKPHSLRGYQTQLKPDSLQGDHTQLKPDPSGVTKPNSNQTLSRVTILIINKPPPNPIVPTHPRVTLPPSPLLPPSWEQGPGALPCPVEVSVAGLSGRAGLRLSRE